MTKEYREARFGNLENFEQYINNNIEEIKKITLKQYLVNNYENNTEYVGKDQFGNLYIFNENNEQKIDIKIDTYTIATNKFIQEYENATEEKKVQMNIDKFIQMINRHDYTNEYNCIQTDTNYTDNENVNENENVNVNENVNDNKNENVDDNKNDKPFPYLSLTRTEYEALCAKYGKERTDMYAERIQRYERVSSQKYNDVYEFMTNWLEERVLERH